jgi:hypothetical protein
MPMSLQNSPRCLAWGIGSCGAAFNAVCVSIGGNLPFEKEQWSRPQLMVVTSPAEFATKSTLPLKRHMVEARYLRASSSRSNRGQYWTVFQLGWDSFGARRSRLAVRRPINIVNDVLLSYRGVV